MHKSIDQSFMKAMNRSIGLDLLRFHSPISRTQISQISGLNKASVTLLIGELIDDGYAVEVGKGHSHGGGRRPIMLKFNADSGHAIGVDLVV